MVARSEDADSFHRCSPVTGEIDYTVHTARGHMSDKPLISRMIGW